MVPTLLPRLVGWTCGMYPRLSSYSSFLVDECDSGMKFRLAWRFHGRDFANGVFLCGIRGVDRRTHLFVNMDKMWTA